MPRLEQCEKPIGISSMRTCDSFHPDISVIVVNYRSGAYLSSCLSSLEESFESLVSCEVIVVNNDKAENLEETRRRFPFMLLINNESNIGFGAAINKGARLARGKILLFLNPDARVEKGFFSKLRKEFAQNSETAIVGPVIYDSQGRGEEWSAGYEMNLWELIRNNTGFSRSRKVWSSVVKSEVHWVSGAALAVRKDVFDVLGGFDERFFMYFEDMDLCRRARALGKKVFHCPHISVFHARGGSRIEEKNRKQLYYASQDYYFDKYYGRLVAMVVRVLRSLF